MQESMNETIAELVARRLSDSGQKLEGPVSVSEFHRVLLPYGSCRDALGFASKGEYDVALLRLLADVEFVEVDRELAKAVERELATPEPGLAFLKNFAAAELRLRPLAEDTRTHADEPAELDAEPAAEPAPASPIEEAADAMTNRHLRLEPSEFIAGSGVEAPDAVSPVAGVVEMAIPEGELRAVDAPVDPGFEAAGGAPCRACDEPLPEREDLRFCPYCGADQREPACQACGETLNAGWAFCPRCGTAVATPE